MEKIHSVGVNTFKVPTDFPESDGTLEWNSTTLALVELSAGKFSGIGYTYTHECAAQLIREKLLPLVNGGDAMDIRANWEKMNAAVRNFGKSGIASTAIAAVDIALWDLKAKILDLPLVKLLGAVREKIPAYGSGGFTSYSERQLRAQLENWAGEGMRMVKMKVGRNPDADERRVKSARKAIGKTPELFVDANGAYSRKQAAAFAEKFSEHGATWFEEPVSGQDLDGLHFIREHAPAKMEISAGEYNYDGIEARKMLEADAVDVLQADATRCGITGFLQVAELCEAFQIPLSSHTAPSLHAHLCCAALRARHAEYFHDHVRIEQLFFDGATTRQKDGFLEPDLSRPGLGLEFKKQNAVKFQI